MIPNIFINSSWRIGNFLFGGGGGEKENEAKADLIL